MTENLQLFQLPHFSAASAEIFVLLMAAVTLVTELLFGKKHAGLSYWLVQCTLIISLFISWSQLGRPAVITFNGLYVADDIGNWLKIFIDITAFGSFFYARQYITDRHIPQPEYYLLGLLSVLGMMVLCSAHSLLMIYLGLETLSLPIYAMIALRRDFENALEAAIKYFVMGAIASGMLLYGMSLLYGATGSLDLENIAHHVALSHAQHSIILSFALVFLIAGVGFKLASVPFHMWAPDVYTGSPASVTLFLSTAPKLAAIGMAIRLLVFALPDIIVQWQPLLIILALLSTALGNVLAVVQTNIKRMLAYSAIGHMGYALFGLIAGTHDGYAFSLFYILVYSLMSLGAFGLVTLMSQKGLEAENIEDFKGLNARNPWLAFLMMIVMFSMAGIPPTAGFFAKLLVLKALVDAHFVWLAVFGLVMAVIGAYYYIRIVKIMYFDSPALDSRVTLGRGSSSLLSINVLSLLLLGFFPNLLVHACLLAFQG